MRRAAMNVVYPATAQRPIRMVVDRLRPGDINNGVARDFLKLISVSYGQQFEVIDQHQGVPRGTMAATFRPDDRNAVAAHRDRMQEHSERYGSQYWLISSLDDRSGRGLRRGLDVIPAVLKVSPSKATWLQRLGVRPPNLYYNDVIVAPQLQGNGIGSALMDVGAEYAGFPSGVSAALDAYRRSSVNRWFEKIGFQPAAEQPDGLAQEFHGHEVPQVRYVSEADLGLSGIAANLRQDSPWLAQAYTD